MQSGARPRIRAMNLVRQNNETNKSELMQLEEKNEFPSLYQVFKLNISSPAMRVQIAASSPSATSKPVAPGPVQPISSHYAHPEQEQHPFSRP